MVEKIPNLDIYHLKIQCDDNVLVYDRKLCSGSGPPIYGLKVCEAMGLSDDFVKGSNDILKYLTKKSDKIVSTKVSQYSSSVFMDECKVCGGLPKDTHHIKEQHTADEHNMIDHHHKNNSLKTISNSSIHQKISDTFIFKNQFCSYNGGQRITQRNILPGYNKGNRTGQNNFLK